MSKRSNRTLGLWAGGLSVYLAQLERDEEDALALLEPDLASADAEVRAHAGKRASAIKTEFRRKRKDAERSLF